MKDPGILLNVSQNIICANIYYTSNNEYKNVLDSLLNLKLIMTKIWGASNMRSTINKHEL